MKKIFTLKTLALGVVSAVALSASATPAEILKVKPAKLFSGKVEMAKKLDRSAFSELSLSKRVITEKAVAEKAAKAPAKRAAASYGPWSEENPGEYTFTQPFTQVITDSYNYRRRLDTANEGELQVEVLKWGVDGEGTTLTFDIKYLTYDTYDQQGNVVGHKTSLIPLVEKPVDTGWAYNGGGLTGEVYMASYSTFLRVNKEVGNQFENADGTKEDITDADIEDSKPLGLYDDVEGYIQFLPVYMIYIDNKPTMYHMPIQDANGLKFEAYQMTGNGYKNYELEVETLTGFYNHEKDAKTGTYTVDVNINDNAKVLLRVATANTESVVAQMLADYKANKLDDLTVVTKSGTVTLPVSNYAKGRRYVVAVIYRDADATDDEALWDVFSTLITSTDVDYYSVGDAEFSDINMAFGINSIFGQQIIPLNDVYTTTVPAQASASKPGMYRLIRPYKGLYEAYLTAAINYFAEEDILEFECNNFDKVNIRPSDSGFLVVATKEDESRMICQLQLGSTNQFANSDNTDSKELWGKYADGAVSFPAPTAEGNQWHGTEASAISFALAEYDLQTGVTSEAVAEDIISMPYPEETKIVFKVAAGVQNVAVDRVDENAPVEYFNLQGIRVANPEAGQLLIKKQGAKTQKVVIR